MDKQSESSGLLYPLYVDPHLFIGKKPVALEIGGESIEVKTWREVYSAILQDCINNPIYLERLMNLRGKASGKIRQFIASTPEKMTRPVKIYEDLYGEVHYGSQTLMHILTERILTPIGYDFSNVKVVVKPWKRRTWYEQM